MLIAAAIAMILLAFALPLVVRSEHIPSEDPVPPAQHLEDRKSAIYENLRDLLAEFQMGKMSSADYATSKRELQTELAGVLAGIEELTDGGRP